MNIHEFINKMYLGNKLTRKQYKEIKAFLPMQPVSSNIKTNKKNR